ncbi:lipocalin family protein [Hymenobacter cellulosilyticus]|uniref:Lipocalin family protein n=2 Tax=Hymenobacter cellulosilyticus TaxID=2932248 RepID=A0A8T9QFM2_9BACT|nr:lipocalin family protein [Hymenobacter cellulosilyticus]
MAYQLRNNITGESLSGGSHYSAKNENAHLAAADFQLVPLEFWVSPRSKQRYPVKWRLRIPSQGYDLLIEPVIPNQELNLRLFKAINLNYWEGMCKVTGTHNGKPVTGNSYVEITNPGSAKPARGAAAAAAK